MAVGRLLSLLFLALSLAAIPAAAVADPLVIGTSGTGPAQFGMLRMLALDANGNLYTTETGACPTSDTCGPNRVQKLTADGTYLTSWGTPGTGDGQFGVPNGISVAPNGDVYVGDMGNKRVEVFAPNGTFLSKFSTAADPGDLAFDDAGDLFGAVTDPATQNTVAKYDLSGALLTGWKVPGLYSLGSSPDGRVYAFDNSVDSSADRVHVFDGNGASLGDWPALMNPDGTRLWAEDISVDGDGRVWIADGNWVGEFDSNGNRLAFFDLNSLGNTWWTTAVAANRDYVYVAASHPDGSQCCGRRAFRVVRLDVSKPTASLTAPDETLTGDDVSLDATASSVSLGTVKGYRWDLDGDGTFESEGGPTAHTTFTTPGTYTVAVQVVSDTGKTSVAKAAISVRPQPPSGPTGVSINNGAQFTNNPAVSLSVVWPAFTLTAVVSNDGGFANAQRVSVGALLPWTLDSSGPERLPKTVYVRFDDSTQTFQDDIILDQVAPVVDAARASAAPSGTAARASVAQTLTLDASDDNSGVEVMQFATDTSQPRPAQPYATSTAITGTPPKYARVRDRAGNYSAWHAIAIVRPVSFALAKTKVKHGKKLVVRYYSPTDATLQTKVIRGQKLISKTSFEIDKGDGTVRIGTKKLRPGYYKLRLTLAKIITTLKFRVTN